MTVLNPALLPDYAIISAQAYLDDPPYDTGPTPPVGDFIEITQDVNHPTGFQGRAYFNSSTNELVIAFTGTEGLRLDKMSTEEFLPDVITDLALAVAGVC